MGRRTQDQRRDRDTSMSRAPSRRYRAKLSHKKSEDKDIISGTVVDTERDPARSAPITLVEFEDEQRMILAPEGISVGEEPQIGVSAEIKPDNTLPLAKTPEGAPVYNIEHQPGDDGKFARAFDMSAQLLSYDRKVAIVKLLPDEAKRLNPNCRTTIGIITGDGRAKKPFIKTRKKYHKMKAHDIK